MAVSISWIVLGLLLTAVLGILDWLSGPEISFGLFYLAPLVLITWRAGRWAGLLVAVASAAAWFWADKTSGREYSQWIIIYWNAGSRLGTFILVAILLASLRESLERERKHARIDFLTGAANSRYFYHALGLEIERARRENYPIAILYVDLDNFKAINDGHGHAAGDRALRVFSNLLQQNLRAADLVARIGGDEFACLLPRAGEKDVQGIIDRLMPALKAQRYADPITFSMGVLICNQLPASADEAIKQADALMYSAKLRGRNQASFGKYEPNETLVF